MFEGFLIQLDPEPRRVGDEQVAPVSYEGLFDQIAFRRLVLVTWILLHDDVVHRCIELHARGGEDTAKRVVQHHVGIAGLGQRRDLFDVCDTASQRKVRSHIGRAIVVE